MSDLDQVVTGPGFAVIVAACWTVAIATIAFLFGKNDGYGDGHADGLREGRRLYIQDAQAELQRQGGGNAAKRRTAALERDLATVEQPRPRPWWVK